MREWIEPQDIRVPQELQTAIGGHQLVTKTLARRGCTKVETARAFLDPDRYRPAPPTDLPNMSEAADRLEKAIQREETICVWGDFDVDGQTATTVLVSTLMDLALRQGSPQAVRQGSPQAVRQGSPQAVRQGSPQGATVRYPIPCPPDRIPRPQPPRAEATHRRGCQPGVDV